MVAITKQPVCTAHIIVCGYCQRVHGFSSKPQKLFNSNVPLGPSEYATGCCIHASVATMKYPESHEPTKIIIAENQWPILPRRFSPNKKSPRNLDSTKNEKTPSIATACPITPPPAFEHADQFVPNSNSIGMPVTTPTAKLIPKIFAQNRAARL